MSLWNLDINPVARAQWAHLAGIVPPRRLSQWLGRVIYGVGLLAGIILFSREFAVALLGLEAPASDEPLRPLGIVLILATAALYLRLILYTLSAAANSIAREHQGGTWEALALTGISGRRFVLGKWWAVARFAIRRSWWLLPLRVALSVYLGGMLSRVFASFYAQYYGTSWTMEPPHPVAILLTIPLSALFTLATVALAAAAGVLASSLARRPGTAVALAAGGFVILTGVGGVGLGQINALVTRQLDFGSLSSRMIVENAITAASVSLVDNGALLLSNLSAYEESYTPVYSRSLDDTQHNTWAGWVLGVILSLILPALAAGAALWLAIRAVCRQGMLAAGDG